MPIQFSLREHKVYAAYNPVWVFSKPTATIVRQRSYPNSSLGRGYIFVVIPRAQLHGKYIRWNWQGYGSLSRVIQLVYIYDGAYDRSSDVDFPSGAALLIKGNGLLQTLDTNSSTFPAETKDIQVNVAGGSEEYCTLFFMLSDAWAGSNFWQQIDWVEINDGPGGAGNLFSEHFTDSVHMERTGTTGDYGYISTGDVEWIESEELAAGFVVRQETSADLQAGFRPAQEILDLPAAFTAAQWQEDLPGEIIIRRTDTDNLPSRFSVRHTATLDTPCKLISRQPGSQSLPAEFISRQAGSQDLGASFDGQVSLNLPAGFMTRQWRENLSGEFITRHASSEDLPGEFIVRQPGSRELLAGFMIRQIGSTDFLGGFTARHSAPVPYLTPWRKRKLHTIKGSIDAVLTDYVVGIKVYYGAGADGTESAKGTIIGKVYCNSKCRTDFGDIRFTAVDGVTELDYWMEEKTDGVSAVFWVKIPSIPLSPDTVNIYVYYGNSSAATTSDGNATFLIFDDFDGDALDTDKWDETAGGNTAVVADGKLKVNITADTYWIDSKIAYDFPDNVEVMSYLDINGLAGTGYRCLFFLLYDRNAVIPMWGGSWYRSDDQYSRRMHGPYSFWWGVWKGAVGGETRHAIGTRSDDWIDWFCEGTQNYNDSIMSPNNWHMCDTRYLRYGIAGYVANNVDLFWIAVRPGTLNVPTHTAWGPEDPPYPQGLLAILDVGQNSEDLAAKFQVGRDSQDLPAEFQVGQGWENLFAEFTVAQLAENLFAGFISRQSESQDLPAEFISGAVTTGSENLPGEFIVRQAGSQDLGASFDAQVSLNLVAKFTVRQPGSQEFSGEFVVRRSTSQELLGEFDVRRDARLNLPAGFTARRAGSQDLLAGFISRQPGSQDLPAEFISRQPDSTGLPAEFISRQPGSQDLAASFDAQVSLNLPAGFISRQAGSRELLAELVVRQSGSQDLLAEFVSRQLDSQELLGEFVIRRDDSQELAAGFISRQAGSRDLAASFDGQVSLNLPAEFISRQPASRDLAASFDGQVSLNLPAEFISRQAGSQDLLGELVVRHPSSQELLAELVVRHSSSQELPGELIVQHSDLQNLLAEFIVRQPGSQDFLAEFISRQSGSQNLLGEFVIRRDGSRDFPARFIVRQPGSQSLPATFASRQPGSQDLAASFDGQVSLNLPAEFISRQAGSQDLLGVFIVRHPGSMEVLGEFIIRHSASQEFPGEFISRQPGSQGLLGGFISRQAGSRDLAASFDGQVSLNLPLGKFIVRQPWPLWTNRYWLNGVVQLDEARISDSFLEEIITGVMDDIKTWLIAEEIGQYSGWTHIDVTPRAIRRAATYGTVASLYARNIFGPQDLVIRVAPMDAKIFTSSEAAMEYWEAMMNRVLELYLSGVGLLRIWIDTIDEDPVFTMEDIPLYTWSPDDSP